MVGLLSAVAGAGTGAGAFSLPRKMSRNPSRGVFAVAPYDRGAHCE